MKKIIISSWIISGLVALHPFSAAKSLEINLDEKFKSFFGQSNSEKDKDVPVKNNDGAVKDEGPGLMTQEEIHAKLRNEAEDKKKKEREGVLSKAPACEADGFKSCYMGASWGSSVEEICSDDKLEGLGSPASNGIKIGSDYSAGANYRDNSKCDTYLSDNLPKQKESCVHENCSLEFSTGSPLEPVTSCQAIAINKKLVGFYKFWPHKLRDLVTVDQFYLIISNLKKKYGKDVEKSQCNDLEIYSWKNTPSGLDILLFKKISDDPMKIYNKTPDGKKTEIFLRYIHKGTFTDLANKQKEIFSKEQKNINNEKDNKLESFGSGI